jgi:hypothetical protein
MGCLFGMLLVAVNVVDVILVANRLASVPGQMLVIDGGMACHRDSSSGLALSFQPYHAPSGWQPC